ncbi:MAG: VOC family protein [Acidimicrobiales bacterium]
MPKWSVAVLADIVFDCRHPASLARFWAQVLDGYDVAPYDADEIARLAALGITDVEDDPTVLVEGPSGPRLWFQRVPEPKTNKNRVHLDVRSADRAAEVRRLVGLGASVLDEPAGMGLTVLCDPEGNEFCVID